MNRTETMSHESATSTKTGGRNVLTDTRWSEPSNGTYRNRSFTALDSLCRIRSREKPEIHAKTLIGPDIRNSLLELVGSQAQPTVRSKAGKPSQEKIGDFVCPIASGHIKMTWDVSSPLETVYACTFPWNRSTKRSSRWSAV